MAESFNTPLLSVVPSDSSGLGVGKNPTKIGVSSANDSQSDAFSRVLDGQKTRDQATQARSDAAASDGDASGKTLPSDGNKPADSATESGSAPQEASAGEASSEAGQTGSAPAAGTDTSVAEGGDEPGFDEADDAARALELSAQNVLAGDGAVAVPVTAEPDAAKTAAYASATAAQSGLAGPKHGPLTAGAQGNQLAAGAQAAGAATISTSATLTDVARDAPSAADSVQAALTPKSVLKTDSTKPQEVGGVSMERQKAGGSSNRLEGGAQIDATALKQTTADWLRASMGTEATAQRGADVPIDVASDLLRGAAAMPRGDALASLAPGSAAAGLAPTATPSMTSSAPASTAAAEYALARAPDDPEFAGELTARMKTLVRDGVREARLQLHPAELGRLQVTVITEGDQTKVAFTAENAAAREAIEQSLPRLREMLEQSGLQLAQSDVGEQGLEGGEQQDGQGPQSLAESEPSEADTVALGVSGEMSSRIDTYI